LDDPQAANWIVGSTDIASYSTVSNCAIAYTCRSHRFEFCRLQRHHFL
jgi:hypothetical protein